MTTFWNTTPASYIMKKSIGQGTGLSAKKALLSPEEVGHGHVTYARTRFSMEISV